METGVRHTVKSKTKKTAYVSETRTYIPRTKMGPGTMIKSYERNSIRQEWKEATRIIYMIFR